MQPTDWPSEHSDALRQLFASGLSYSLIAEAINARFSTTYSRNAAIGRAKRMGLAGPARPGGRPRPVSLPRHPQTSSNRRPPRFGCTLGAVPHSSPWKQSGSEASKSFRVIFRLLNSILATAVIHMAATPMARPSLSAVIRADKAQATVPPIFT